MVQEEVMTEKSSRPNRISDLLNSSTPFAPADNAEIRERLVVPASQPDADGDQVFTEADIPVPQRTGDDEERRVVVSEPATPPPLIPADPMSALGGLYELIAEVDAFSSSLRMATTPEAGDVEHEGRDASETVSVTIAPDGGPLRLGFLRPWRRGLTPETFDTAVMEACANASISRVTALMSGFENVDPSATVPGAPGPAAPKAPGVPTARPRSAGPEIDTESALRHVNLLANEFSDALARAESELGSMASEPPGLTVQSEKRRVTLTIVGDAITGVATHHSWLRDADESRIAEEFASAFSVAREAIERGTGFEPALTPGIEQLQKVINELQEVAAGMVRIPWGEGR
ncbi:hypothetical protein AB0J52_12785 [Spirillospora sp. NPDC049652]